MDRTETKMAIECGWMLAKFPSISLAHSLYNLMSGFGKAAEVFPMICGWTEAHKEDLSPKLVHHYTDMNGIDGIIFKPIDFSKTLIPGIFKHMNSTNMFAMGVKKIGSSNDPSEGGILCDRLFRNVTSDLHKKELITSEFEQLIEAITSRVDTIYSQWSDVVEYMACFSEERDFLPLWGRYADDGTGVSLGFDFREMGLLFPLLYSRAEQLYCIYKACKEMHAIFEKEYASNSKEVERAIVALFELFSGRFKSESYSYEKEWRLRINNTGKEYDKMICDGRLLVALPKYCLKEVILCPNTPTATMDELSKKLQIAGYHCKVLISDIPYISKKKHCLKNHATWCGEDT